MKGQGIYAFVVLVQGAQFSQEMNKTYLQAVRKEVMAADLLVSTGLHERL